MTMTWMVNQNAAHSDLIGSALCQPNTCQICDSYPARSFSTVHTAFPRSLHVSVHNYHISGISNDFDLAVTDIFTHLVVAKFIVMPTLSPTPFT
jgi:hypothetical protein